MNRVFIPYFVSSFRFCDVFHIFLSLKVKSKVAAKTGKANYQWQIMQNMGLDDDSIKK